MLLAIETSCDETAVALFATSRCLAGSLPQPEDLLAEALYSQVATHQAYGGVVPEIAAREHVLRLPILIDEIFAKANVTAKDVTIVAVTSGPGLKGCLLVGLSWAKGFALAQNIPLVAVNHIEGHLLSGEIGLAAEYQYPCLVLVVSGGHTELVLIKSFRDYQIVARTRDDAAGEAFDKTASLLELGYPGGPALSQKATTGDNRRFSFSVSSKGDPTLFSFSGLKTAAWRTITAERDANGNLDEQTRCDLAASIEQGIVQNLIDKTILACKAFQPKQLIITGGVAANKTLRSAMSEALTPLGVAVYAPPFSLCTDNAVMIGYAALRTVATNPPAYRNWSGTKNSGMLGPNVPASLGATPRYPIEQIAPQELK